MKKESRIKAFLYWLYQYQVRSFALMNEEEIRRLDLPRTHCRLKGEGGGKLTKDELEKRKRDIKACNEKALMRFFTICPLQARMGDNYSSEQLLETLGNAAEFETIIEKFAPQRKSRPPVKVVGVEDVLVDREKRIKGNVLLRVDLSQDVDVISKYIETLQKKEFLTTSVFATIAETIEVSGDDIFESLLVKKAGGVFPRGHLARIFGLWIWDRVHGFNMTRHQRGEIPCSHNWVHGMSQAEAICALEKRYTLVDFGKDKVNETELRHYYRKTKDCIQAAQVLSFSKKGNQKTKKGSWNPK